MAAPSASAAQPTQELDIERAMQKVDARSVKCSDPISIGLLLIALALAFGAAPRSAIAPSILAGVCASLFLRMRDLTSLRIFSLALCVRIGAAVLMAFLASGAPMASSSGEELPVPERIFPGAIFPDEPYTAAEAKAVLRDPEFAGIPLRSFGRAGIGYIYAPFLAAGGDTLSATRYASALAGSLGVALIYMAGRFVVGESSSRRAAMVTAIMPGLVIFSATGLKEGLVTLFLGSSLLCAYVFAVGRVNSHRPWSSALALVGIWGSLAFLVSLRENLGFAVGLTIPLVALLNPGRWSERVFRALALLLISLSCYWALGFGVMGSGIVEFVNPSYLGERHEQGKVDIDRAQAIADSDSSSGSVAKIVSRFPGGLWLMIARPYPFEGVRNSHGAYSALSRAATGVDQFIWYPLFVLALIGWIRVLRKFPGRTIPPASLLAGVLGLYAVTLANAGTAYRLRLALAPLLFWGIFVPSKPRSPDDSRSIALVIPTLGQGGTENHVLRIERAIKKDGRNGVIAVLRKGLTDRERRSDAESRRCDEAASQCVDVEMAERERDVINLGRVSRYDLMLPWRIARRLGHREPRPSLLSTYLFAGNFWGGLASRLIGCVLVSNVRTTHPRGVAQRLLEPLVSGDLIIVNSESVAEAAARRGIDPRRIVIVRNGVDLDELRNRAGLGCEGARSTESLQDPRTCARKAHGLEETDWVILVPGRIDPLKNQIQAIDAFEVANIERSVLCFAGGAELDAEQKYLEQLRLRSKGMGSRVRFFGNVNNLPALMAAADTVLLTSEHEGMPNALLEAMALEVPVVATAAGGVREVLKPRSDTEVGWLLERNDVSGIARALKEINENPTRAGLYAQAGRQLVASHFGIAKEQAAILSAFDLAAARAAAADRPCYWADESAAVSSSPVAVLSDLERNRA